MGKSLGKDANVIRTSIILSDVLKFIHQQLSEMTNIVLVPSIITLHYRIIQNGAFSSRYISSLASKEKYHYNTWQLLTSIHPVIHSSRADAWAKRPSLASPRPLCPDVGSPGVPRPAGNPPPPPGLPQGLHSGGHAWKTSAWSCPGAILSRCPSHLAPLVAKLLPCQCSS